MPIMTGNPRYNTYIPYKPAMSCRRDPRGRKVSAVPSQAGVRAYAAVARAWRWLRPPENAGANMLMMNPTRNRPIRPSMKVTTEAARALGTEVRMVPPHGGVTPTTDIRTNDMAAAKAAIGATYRV